MKRWNKDLFAVILVLVVAFFALRYISKEREHFTNPYKLSVPWTTHSTVCKFLTARETYDFIMDDPDQYSHSLTEWDLIARKVTTEYEYRTRAAASATSFTEAQKTRFRTAAKKADNFFSTYAKTCSFLDLSTMKDIPWVFGLTRGNSYEDGLSHTRANIIFVSALINETPARLYQVLVHEKIHLFQRLYPVKTTQYLQRQGYKRWKFRVGVPRIRSNPDLDPWIYINPSTESPMMSVYASDTPTSISDTTIPHGEYEHPYEEMSYMIEKDAAKM